MDWDSNNYPTNFCHAFKELWGHQSIDAPFLLHVRPPAAQMSSLCLWLMEADIQAASSCSNPCLDVLLPCTSSSSSTVVLVTRLPSGCCKRVISNSASARSCRSHHRLHTKQGTSSFTLCLIPPVSPLCFVPTHRVTVKTYLLLTS